MRALFLEELRKRGNVTDAVAAAGMARTTAYEWREKDPEFAAAWGAALDEAADALEKEAWRRAYEGVEEPLIGRVERDRDDVITYVRRYSDSLMQLLLKAHKPEKYRERQEVQHSGKVEVSYVNDWREDGQA